MTQGEDGGDNDDFFWGVMGARLIHPAQVAIIEAMRWIGLPLSASDLIDILDDDELGRRLEHHLRRLVKLGAVVPVDLKTSNSAATQRYRLGQGLKL